MLDKSQLSPEIKNASTLSQEEVAKFDQMAKEWWDPKGKFKTALAFNNARLGWMVSEIGEHFSRDVSQASCLQGLTILDVGSGGGLISEKLAELGADVLGIDASAVSVEVASRHAELNKVKVQYEHKLSADLVAENRQFDIVINAEVVEHVPDQNQLIQECCQLTKPGGLLLLATLNRTLKSYIIAILGAEYVMRYLPVGTHDWRYFVKPVELAEMAQANGALLRRDTGMKLNPLSKAWRLSKDLSVNYIQSYVKADRAD